MPHASIKDLLRYRAFLQANPTGTIHVNWLCQYRGKAEYDRWFLRCLHAKISRADPRARWAKFQDDYHASLHHDARLINDALSNRAHFSGRNLLHTKWAQARYPAINTRTIGD